MTDDQGVHEMRLANEQPDGDPSTERWRAALRQSTSAQLAETQQALASSQADLTQAIEERDRANSQVEVELIKLANVRELWGEERAELERERQESGRLRRELEQLGDIVHRCSACSTARHA